VADPVLHAVTDDAILAADGFAARADAVLEAGGAAVALHLRGPETGGRALFDAAARLRPVAARHGALLIVNDRVDVALAAGADGVQLGRRSLAVADARRLLGDGPRIGVSVHAAGEALAVAGLAAWVLAGTVWPSASHPGRAPSGTGVLAAIAATGPPTVAIGGVTPGRVAEARAAGAAGIAVRGGIWAAADPAAAVRAYLDAWGVR
jgi:thiamine-phosphate diphosphorylase